MIESLRKRAKVYGDKVVITGAGDNSSATLDEMAKGFANRFISLYTSNANERRPIFGKRAVAQEDAYLRDCLSFHEYSTA